MKTQSDAGLAGRAWYNGRARHQLRERREGTTNGEGRRRTDYRGQTTVRADETVTEQVLSTSSYVRSRPLRVDVEVDLALAHH